jgi:hypothetical protein
MLGPYNKRLEAWRVSITAVVNELAAKYDNLLDDDVFLDAFINATRVAQSTHQQEKLDALRNGVVNSVGPNAPDVDEQARFFRLVDQFSAAHLVVLRRIAAARPPFALDEFSEASGGGGIVHQTPPEFDRRRPLLDILLADLLGASLLVGSSTDMRGGMFYGRATTLGGRFLDFISEGH